MRVLLVATDAIVPGRTHSGNAAIRGGLITALRALECEVRYVDFAVPQDRAQRFVAACEELGVEPETMVVMPPMPAAAAPDALRAVEKDFSPDWCLTFGHEALDLARRAEVTCLTGLTSIDLEFQVPLYRACNNIMVGSWRQRIKSLLDLPQTFWESWREYRRVLHRYPLADFIVNNAAHHAVWHARKHARPTLYVPNWLALEEGDVPARMDEPDGIPRFVLFGGLGGIATLTGLNWFARHVYPLIEADLERGGFSVEIVGRGALPSGLGRKMPHVVERGYVDDLAQDMRSWRAVLAPTPIELGFRTRILEAFRNGLPVIAHSANAKGMPELQDGVNCCLVERGHAFAGRMRMLAASPMAASLLGREAARRFQQDLNAIEGTARMLSFVIFLQQTFCISGHVNGHANE